MKFVNRLKFNATGTSAAALTIGAAVSSFRDLIRAISDGDLAVTDVSMPLTVQDGNGNVQTSLYDMGGTAQAPTITLKSILTSSLGGKQAVTFSGPLTVFNGDEATYLNTLLSSSQGVAPSGLSAAGTLAGSNIFLLSQDGGATIVTTTLTAIAAAVASINGTGGGTPTESLTIATIAAQTAGTAFSVSGTYANGTPAALDWSINGGTTWSAAATPTISGGNYSFGGVTVPSANASQTVMVRDHTNTGITATSAAFVVNAAASGGPVYPRVVDLAGSFAVESGSNPYSYVASFNNTMSGLLDKGFLAGQDGSVTFLAPDTSDLTVGLVTAKVTDWTGFAAGVRITYTNEVGTGWVTVYNGTGSPGLVAKAANTLCRIARVSGTVTMSLSTDSGSTWTTLGTPQSGFTGAYKIQLLSQYAHINSVTGSGLG